MKRNTIYAAAALCAVAALSGCAKSEKKVEESGPVTLKVMDWSDSTKPQREAFYRAFEAKHPNIKIEYTCLTVDQYKNTVLSAVNLGDAPDLFPVPVGMDLNSVAKEGWFQPLDPYVPADFRDRFMPGSFAEGINLKQGKLYSVAESVGLPSTVVFYNKDLFAKAGLDPEQPPKTFSELRAYAAKITKAGKGKFYGIIEGGQQVNRWKQAAVDFSSLGGSGLSSGDPMNSPVSLVTGKSTYDHPAMIETFKLFKGMADDGSYHPSTFSIRAPEARALFGAGQAGFIIQGVWCVGPWAQSNPELKLGVCAPPLPDSGRKGSIGIGTAGAWIGMSAKTAHPKEAGMLLDAMYSNEYSYQKDAVAAGAFFSTMKGINEGFIVNPILKDYYSRIMERSRVAPNPKSIHPETTAFYAEYQDVTPGIGDLLQGVVSGSIKDIEGSLNELAGKVDQATEAAVKKAHAQDPEITIDDFKFDWNPMENY